MGKVNVVIVNTIGNTEQKIGLPDDIKCETIIANLIETFRLPSRGLDGNPICYEFIHKITGRQLSKSQTLGEFGIKDGDVLCLQRETDTNTDNNPNLSSFTPKPSANNNYDSLVATKRGNSNVFPIIGIISGAFSILLGIIELTKSTGKYAQVESYGGDAYTGIQHAAAYTANNIRYLAEICRNGIGAVLIVLGLGMICYFAMKINDSKSD